MTTVCAVFFVMTRVLVPPAVLMVLASVAEDIDFHLYYTENGTDTITLSVVTESAKEAENMEIEFEQHPELFRRALLSLLTNNAAPIDEYKPYHLI